MRRRTPKPTLRFSAPHTHVEAETDLQWGIRWVPRGTRLDRSDPLVVAHPEVFRVVYRLSEEVKHDAEAE
jgi:hypothetical protein